MWRFLLLTMVGCGLVLGASAHAADRVAKTGPTSKGHSFTTSVSHDTIYVYPSGQAMQRPEASTQFPPQSTLTVSVVDASGKPASGVPVSFEVAQNSTLQGMLDITPKQTTTGADGKVQATIMPSTGATTGSGDVLVRVDDKTEAVAMTLEKSKVRNTQ